MPTQLVGRAVARVRAAGGDADGLILAHDLPPTVESDPFILLSVPRLHAVLDAAERAANDPFLGVNIACGHDDSNVIAFACRGAPDLRSALTRCIGLITSFNQMLVVTFEERGGRGRVDMTITDQPLGLGRHGNEYWITALLLQARRLSGDECAPERAWLAHPAPRDTSEIERVLGTSKLKFGVASTGFAIPTRVLDAPLRSADPLLRGLLDRSAQSMLARRADEGAFVARVRSAIAERLPDGAPSIDDAARACGVSARTLQRRLGENGTTFRRVLDSVRSDVSSMHIDDRAMSLDQVASLVGFAQASGLARAIRRWTGKPPRDGGGGREG
jgi:AraC-like DNA-binding protein